jgi:transposase
MPQNFIECDREQAFLMPPSLRDWLPADHLAWFVIESVARLDLDAFYAAAYRVITGNRVPDHATIARFIVRHEQRLAELFTSVLRLCATAGLVKSGVVAVDGTRLLASANSDSNVGYDRIARQIIAEAIALVGSG